MNEAVALNLATDEPNTSDRNERTSAEGTNSRWMTNFLHWKHRLTLLILVSASIGIINLVTRSETADCQSLSGKVMMGAAKYNHSNSSLAELNIT